MLLLRAVLLELLVCVHVVGGAVLFRRLFPRESPWFGYFVPTLLVMAVCNFVEHFVPLTELGWLLPFTVLGLGYVMARGGVAWQGLGLPTGLFLGIFTWAFYVRCLNPAITCNTEGVADMARVLDFCLGSRLPPVDVWCPPYDHGGYYTFQHYGASLLKRLFLLDIGTGYNVGYTLLNALTLLAGAGAAYAISGRRMWVCLGAVLILLANFTGSSVLLLYWNSAHPVPNLYAVFDSRLAVDIGDGWNDPNRHNPFGWIFHAPPPGLRLFTPAFNTYFPEFHANLGGHFMTLFTLLAAHEAFRLERSNWPWICLLLASLLTLITATWFIIVVGVLAAGCLVTAWISGRRPENLRIVIGGVALGLCLLWPTVDSLISGTYPVKLIWTPWDQHTNPWEFLIQWWPVIVPWLCLLFIWKRLSWMSCWVMVALPLLLVLVEVFTIGDRTLTVEKMWGAIYGAALVSFLPLAFAETGVAFRLLTRIYLIIALVFVGVWGSISYETAWRPNVLLLGGDYDLQSDPQKKRLEQVLSRLHNATVLSGRCEEAYNQSPSLVGFTSNKCYIAWYFQEYQCGHGGEAEFRARESADFYSGKMEDPLGFLHSNGIAAAMVYPDDTVPDDVVAKLRQQLAGGYRYIDCKGDGPNNAGVFVPLTSP
jgi:hypothetical protein